MGDPITSKIEPILINIRHRMSQSANNPGTEEFKKALLDGPSGLREILAKLNSQKESLEENSQPTTPKDKDFEMRKMEILTIQKRVELLKRNLDHLKQENDARVKHLKNFHQFVTERENSIKNIENIDKTVAENATKKVSLVERRYEFLSQIELQTIQIDVRLQNQVFVPEHLCDFLQCGHTIDQD